MPPVPPVRLALILEQKQRFVRRSAPVINKTVVRPVRSNVRPVRTNRIRVSRRAELWTRAITLDVVVNSSKPTVRPILTARPVRLLRSRAPPVQLLHRNRARVRRVVRDITPPPVEPAIRARLVRSVPELPMPSVHRVVRVSFRTPRERPAIRAVSVKPRNRRLRRAWCVMPVRINRVQQPVGHARCVPPDHFLSEQRPVRRVRPVRSPRSVVAHQLPVRRVLPVPPRHQPVLVVRVDRVPPVRLRPVQEIRFVHPSIPVITLVPVHRVRPSVQPAHTVVVVDRRAVSVVRPVTSQWVVRPRVRRAVRVITPFQGRVSPVLLVRIQPQTSILVIRVRPVQHRV